MRIKTERGFVEFYALAPKVLCVAKVNLDVGDWAVYIDAVPGKRHDHEWQKVAHEGEKLPKKIAEEIFFGLKGRYEYRK